MDPNSLTHDNRPITCLGDSGYQPDEPYHITDAFSDNAAKYVREHDFSVQPMIMNLAFTAAHWPMHARERDIAKYQGRCDAGYQAIRQARLARMKQLGVIARFPEITARTGDWEKVPDPQWEADWKLVAMGPMKDRELPVKRELHNIVTDRNEMHDRAGDDPERVAQMNAMWEVYA